nr:alcohol dehydrogenase catalytic domain-containing protein [Alkalibacter mobilis]
MVLEDLEKLVVVNCEKPKQKNDVIIKVSYCGVCGADMKSYRKGHRDLFYPRVLGHEITGEIEYVPAELKEDFKVGDRVQIFPGNYCNNCRYCDVGKENLCDSMEILGFHKDGGMQEFIEIKGASAKKVLNKIPDGLSPDIATFAEPVACAINIQEKVSIKGAENILILGAGRLGMINYFLAEKSSHGSVVIADVYSPRLSTAIYKKTLDLSQDDADSILNEITCGKGPDVVLICNSSPQSLVDAIRLCSKGGKIGYFSGLHKDEIDTKILNELHYKEIQLFGSYGCTFKGNSVALELLDSGMIPFEKLMAETYSLNDVEKAIFALEEKSVMSAIIKL